ncbi:MAG: TonB family protein [Colwellia sp.]|nr:TonB family protein [Colwellia sp.]
MKKLLLISALAPFFLMTNNAVGEELSKHLTTIIDPTPIKRVQPKYPINAARSGREGWAKLSFVISKEGDVSNVIVTETSGSADFAKEAKKAVLKWKYQPAFENGEAIEQCANSVQMSFKMADNRTKGVTKRFRRKYQSAVKAMEDKDYALLEELLDDMSHMKNRHLSENNYMHLLAANYAELTDDKEKQLYHLNRVTIVLLSEERAFSTLNSMFMLEIALNNLQSVQRTYNRLIKLALAKPHLAQYQQILAKVERFVDGEQDIVRRADIAENDYWHASLVRNEFSLTNIEGSLNKLDVRCANKHHIYSVENNNTWTLPASWKNCSIYIYGDDNTRFNLVEHSAKS